jgi:hypothetical protein
MFHRPCRLPLSKLSYAVQIYIKRTRWRRDWQILYGHASIGQAARYVAVEVSFRPSPGSVYTECYDMPQFGRPEWLTTVTFDETLQQPSSRTILHKSREGRDGHLQAGMQEGMVQTLGRLNEHTAAMEPLQ